MSALNSFATNAWSACRWGGALAAISLLATPMAAADDEQVANEILNTGISLIEAVRSAETTTAGIAYEAELDNEDGRWVFEIETLTPADTIKKTYVDSTTGNVINTKIDDSYEHSVASLRSALTRGITLANAIVKAESRLAGTAYEADLDKRNGLWVYEIEVSTASATPKEGYINVSSGQFVADDNQNSSDNDSGDDISDVSVSDMSDFALTLTDAIVAAESATAGRAYDAEIEFNRGSWFYEVEVVLDSGERREVRVDVNTGEITRNRQESGSFQLIDNRDIKNMSRAQIRRLVKRTESLCKKASTASAIRACLKRHRLK